MWLKQEIDRAGIKRIDLAKRMGMSRSQLWYYEKQDDRVTIKLLKRFIEELSISKKAIQEITK